MLTLLVTLHNEFSWQLARRLVDSLKNFCLLLSQFALEASLNSYFIILAPENFSTVGVGYIGTSSYNTSYLVDHSIVLLLRRTYGG